MVKMLKTGGALQHLDLSGVPISMRFQLPLCKAIGRHERIESIGLAETGFTTNGVTIQCLSELLKSKTLARLDLSWNSFDGQVFKALGGFAIESKSLRYLSVANCAA